MGLIIVLLAVSIAVVMIGIIQTIAWLTVIGAVLVVASIIFAAVRGPDSA